jgi:hypothetical protein
MDATLLKKLQRAADEANEIIRKRGPMFLDEMAQVLADHFANHPDPDVRAFQEAHNRQVDKRLN